MMMAWALLCASPMMTSCSKSDDGEESGGNTGYKDDGFVATGTTATEKDAYYDFSANDKNGQTIYFKITSYENRTVIVTHRYDYSSKKKFNDKDTYRLEIAIPSRVTWKGVTFSVVEIGEHAFYECTSLTSVRIPNSITSIGDYAFEECTSLMSVNIPNGVTSIGEGAFYECTSLTSVSIPNSITSIGFLAIYGCTSLTSVYSYIKSPFPTPFITDNWIETATLYVPKGTKEAYEETFCWSWFKKIVEMDE